MPDVEIVLHPTPTADSKPYIIVYGPDRWAVLWHTVGPLLGAKRM